MWDDNCFITLTYDEENLPWDGSLDKKHFQKFMKRLRWKHREKTIRFFHVGEYGSDLDRPHYHALLYNHDFDDKYLWNEKEGICTYRSDQLEELWPYGMSTVGELNWETAAYCSRYCVKKITGEKVEEHYRRIDTRTGEVINLEPEYITMSLRPAIGKSWYEKWKADCYPSDFITNNGKKLKLPRYYDKLYQEENEPAFARLKETRKAKALEHAEDQTPARLRTREACQTARAKLLQRNYEQ